MDERRIDEAAAGRLERVAPRARRLLAARPGGLEAAAAHESSGGGAGPPGAGDVAAIAAQLRRARPPLAGIPATAGDPVAEALARELVAHAARVMQALGRGASENQLTAGDALALEAVLRVRGRPALRVEGETIEPIDDARHPGSGIWRSFLDQFEGNVLFAAAATGAVVVSDPFGAPPEPWVQGTAWLVREDLAVTNRHVLFPPLGGMRLARRLLQPTTARLKSDLKVTIDFAFDSGPRRSALYEVESVLFVAEEADPVDVALLKVRPIGDLRPPPLTLAPGDFDQDYLYVVGHPGRMQDVPDDVRAVFGDPDERKRASFGELMDADPANPGELIYDASTIGGFSGGCVLGFRTREVVGLHYYGDPLNGNRAIAATQLAAHPAGALMAGGG